MANTPTTIITGASGGIGSALAETYLKEGHNLVLTGRDATKLEGLAKRLNAPGRYALVAGDLRNEETVRSIVSTATDHFGPTLRNLINNAGTFLVKPLMETTSEDLQPYLDLLRSTYLLTRLSVQQMVDQAKVSGSRSENGSIIFVSTIFTRGFISQFPCSAVGAVKAAYTGFARNACLELASSGIRVNTVDLGVIETPIYGLDARGLEALRELQPLNANGQPRDVAETIAFLTERSPFTTGQVIAIDGGVSAGHYVPN